MAALKLYPVGIQTFEDIINRNLLYVDKTEYIYRMTHGGGKYFFWFTTGTPFISKPSRQLADNCQTVNCLFVRILRQKTR